MLGLEFQARCSIPDPLEVTRIAEEAPTSVPVHRIWGAVTALYRTGLHPAIGLCMRHRGDVILDRTIGHLHNPPGGQPGAVATPSTLFNLFSASKILTSFVMHALIEDGLLDLNAPVAHYRPSFGRHGKHRVRVHHLLDHTAGIPDMPAGIDALAALARGEAPLDAIDELPLQSPPGANVAYNPMTAWMLLEDLLKRVTGSDLRAVARERIASPLGLLHLGYGVAPDEVNLVAKHAYTGPPTAPPMARIFERSIGVDLDTAVALTNDPAFLTAILPSANVIGTGREATRFLQMLLNGGTLGGTRVLAEHTVRRAVTQTTPLQFDSTFGFPMRYGLGLMMGGDRFSLFGLTTRRAFGHLGFTNVVVYADPTRDLCVSFLNTGKPMLAPGMLRWYWTLQQIALSVPRRGTSPLLA